MFHNFAKRSTATIIWVYVYLVPFSKIVKIYHLQDEGVFSNLFGEFHGYFLMRQSFRLRSVYLKAS